MNDINKYNLIWSVICFAFISALCFIFNSAMPLWLLIVWLMGYGLSK